MFRFNRFSGLFPKHQSVVANCIVILNIGFLQPVFRANLNLLCETFFINPSETESRKVHETERFECNEEPFECKVTLECIFQMVQAVMTLARRGKARFTTNAIMLVSYCEIGAIYWKHIFWREVINPFDITTHCWFKTTRFNAFLQTRLRKTSFVSHLLLQEYVFASFCGFVKPSASIYIVSDLSKLTTPDKIKLSNWIANAKERKYLIHIFIEITQTLINTLSHRKCNKCARSRDRKTWMDL